MVEFMSRGHRMSGKISKMKIGLFGLVLISITLAGCIQETEQPKEKVNLKIGVLPIEDSLPLVIAKEEGIFDKYGLNVDIVMFQSALERDSALTSGEVSAVVTDPLAVILLKNGGIDVRIVSICLGKTPQEGVFKILASPSSNITDVKDIEGKKIAISRNTIIEYVTDKLLGDMKDEVEKVEIKKIPLRLQTLLDNKVDMATLPEPLASLAELKGAKKILSDSEMDDSISHTVIVFKGSYIDENKDAVEKFLLAYDDAVERINSDPSRYRDKFIEIARVPEPLVGTYKMPKYPKSEIFPEKYFNEYLEWAKSKGLIEKEISYESVIYGK
jgi:NitT/TauT family transport system substrate-binding protein